MIELPEARTISKDLRKEILGKTVINVSGNFTDHKFTFYYKDPNDYKKHLVGKKITKINDRNYYIEIEIEDYLLLIRDGANIRYYNNIEELPNKSKLLLSFNDGTFLNITTSMYSMIYVFSKEYGIDNIYYDMELKRIGANDKEFTFGYFKSLIDEKTLKLSVKAFLATEQRILGIGNGIVQDILFNARINPKRKIKELTKKEMEQLYITTKDTIIKMINENGRDTEKDIYGENGGYQTLLSSKTYKNGCSICKNEIRKEQYLGGSIYYCPKCQK